MTLCKSIKELGVDLQSQAALDYATYILRYIVGLDNAFAFQRNFKGACESAKVFRLGLANQAYFTLQLKYAFLSAALGKLTPEQLSSIQADFQIVRDDMVMLKRVLLQRGLRKEVKTTGVRSSDVTRSRMQFDLQIYQQLYPHVLRVIGSITYRRMRFITTSTNTEFVDLNNELVCKSLNVFYSMMPIRKELAHVKNYVLRAVNNHAINMIEERTSGKRGRLVQGAKDGFGGHNYDLTVVSNNQLKVEEAEIAYDDLASDGSDLTETLDFDRLLKRYSAPNCRTFLLLVTGNEDPAFTDYLRRQKCLRQGEDSSDYYHRADRDQYHAHITAFLGIDKSLSNAFLGFLGRALGR